VGSEKRERQKTNRENKHDEVSKLADREVWRQRTLLFVVLAALFGGTFFLLTGGSDEDPAAQNEFAPLSLPSTTAPDATTTSTTTAELLLEPPTAGAAIEGTTPCPAEDGSSARTTVFSEAPPMCIDPAAIYTALVSTDKGDITIQLDASKAPATVNNFVVLARYGFYDGVPFHRIIPGFMIQGGDAVGPTLGIGNPGYQFPDELPEQGEYEVGSVAMANSGENTNGSQFFIVTGAAGEELPPLYSLFGSVSEGLDVMREIEAVGSAGAGKPSEMVTIQSITITEG